MAFVVNSGLMSGAQAKRPLLTSARVTRPGGAVLVIRTNNYGDFHAMRWRTCIFCNANNENHENGYRRYLLGHRAAPTMGACGIARPYSRAPSPALDASRPSDHAGPDRAIIPTSPSRAEAVPRVADSNHDVVASRLVFGHLKEQGDLMGSRRSWAIEVTAPPSTGEAPDRGPKLSASSIGAPRTTPDYQYLDCFPRSRAALETLRTLDDEDGR